MSRSEQRNTTLLAILAFGVVLITWQMVDLQVLLYPLRLFVTLIHELGHGTAAILTGGTFIRFEVFPNGSGLAYTSGGWLWAILPAGYLGAAAFGALLLILANRVKEVRTVAVLTASLVAGAVILFSSVNREIVLGILVFSVAAFLLGDHFKTQRTPLWIFAVVGAVLLTVLIWTTTSLRVGIGFAVVLGAIGLFAPRLIVTFILNFLAMIVGFNAITDIAFLLNNPSAAVGVTRNDAAAMAQLTQVPTAFWAFAWMLLALALMLSAAWIAFIQPHRKS